MNILDINKSTIIVCSNNEKKNLLKIISKSPKLLPIKFVSKNEFIKLLTFSYDEKTLYYVRKKYNIRPEVAKVYLDNIYFVSLKKYDSDKLNFLVNLKKDLLESNLLKTDDLFKNNLKGKDVILYNLGYIDNYFENLLNGIKDICNVIIFNKEKELLYTHDAYEFTSIEDEVQYASSSICKLILSGVNINKIKLIINDNKYFNYIKRIFKMYNIPVNLNEKIPIYFTMPVSYLLKNFTSNLEDVIHFMKEKYDSNIINKILNILNKFTFESDKTLVKEDIIYYLKQTYLDNEKYENAVAVESLDSINDDDYVFLLGFNQKFYPKVFLDEDYLTNKEKTILGLESSFEITKKEKDDLIYRLSIIKNLFISYKLESDEGKFLPSTLINELNMNVKSEKISFNYSNKVNKYLLTKYLDNFYKYGIVTNDLKTLYNNYEIGYKTYDNKYKKVPFSLLNKVTNGSINLSYSSMQVYNECKFKYFLKYILKLDIYKDSFIAYLGTLFHHILEISTSKDIDVHEEINNFISGKTFSEKELFYIYKLEDDINLTINVIKEQNKYSLLDNFKTENEFKVIKNGKLNVIYKGYIDKLLYKEIDGKTYFAIVDYKTGDIDINMNFLKMGLGMQLPIYLYLIKNENPNGKICGFYIQKVLLLDNKYDESKSLNERKIDSLKLSGYSNSDKDVLNKFDYNYASSKVIKGLKLKNDGNFYAYSKVLSDEKMDEIYKEVDKQIDLAIKGIENCDFTVNPKIYKNKNLSCEFCKFKDICFKTFEDNIEIEMEEEDGVDK